MGDALFTELRRLQDINESLMRRDADFHASRDVISKLSALVLQGKGAIDTLQDAIRQMQLQHDADESRARSLQLENSSLRRLVEDLKCQQMAAGGVQRCSFCDSRPASQDTGLGQLVAEVEEELRSGQPHASKQTGNGYDHVFSDSLKRLGGGGVEVMQLSRMIAEAEGATSAEIQVRSIVNLHLGLRRCRRCVHVGVLDRRRRQNGAGRSGC